MDFICETKGAVNRVVLTGEAVKTLCSIYISGGRNVALRQQTSQSSTYWEWPGLTYGPEKAVDGNINSDFSGGSCSATTESGYSSWSVNILRPATVYRYVLYNRLYVEYRLKGFSLTSYTIKNAPVYNYTESSERDQLVYTVIPEIPIQSVSRVVIQGKHVNVILTLCEVEIYGETQCESGKYGKECEHTCNCASTNEPCFVSTGACSTECAAGFLGEGCTQLCPEGTYGHGCKFNCSKFCVPNSFYRSCSHIDGICTLGCQDYYYGPNCDSVCPKGTFGKDCKSKCTQFCMAGNSDTRVCDLTNGTCLNGCQDGYISPLCNQTCPAGTFGQGCRSTCSPHCVQGQNETCHPIDGTCDCQHGYKSPGCSEMDVSSSHSSPPTGVIVGAVVGAVAAVGIAIGAAVVWCQRKKTERQSGHDTELSNGNKREVFFTNGQTDGYEQCGARWK